MAYIRLLERGAMLLEKAWRAASKAYPDVVQSYAVANGAPGVSTMTSSPSIRKAGFLQSLFGSESNAARGVHNTEYICRNGVLTTKDSPVPIGDGVCTIKSDMAP